MQKNSSTKGSVMRGGSTTIRPAQGSFTTRKYDTTTATDTGGHNLGLLVGLPVAIAVLLLLMIFCLCRCTRRLKRQRSGIEHTGHTCKMRKRSAPKKRWTDIVDRLTSHRALPPALPSRSFIEKLGKRGVTPGSSDPGTPTDPGPAELRAPCPGQWLHRQVAVWQKGCADRSAVDSCGYLPMDRTSDNTNAGDEPAPTLPERRNRNVQRLPAAGPAPGSAAAGPAPRSPAEGPAPSSPAARPAPGLAAAGPAPGLAAAGPAHGLVAAGPAPGLAAAGPAPGLAAAGPAPGIAAAGPAPGLVAAGPAPGLAAAGPTPGLAAAGPAPGLAAAGRAPGLAAAGPVLSSPAAGPSPSSPAAGPAPRSEHSDTDSIIYSDTRVHSERGSNVPEDASDESYESSSSEDSGSEVDYENVTKFKKDPIYDNQSLGVRGVT